MVILVVEDDKNIAQFIQDALETEQYTVELAHDGEEAMNKISIRDYDLVILDLMLPKKDGLEVCREIRSLGMATPVIMLTARDMVTDKVKGLSIGADDYLAKPFELDELIARVRALMRRGTKLQPDKIQVGDLVLDTTKHEVTRGGKQIELTNKEYRILEYLMRNAGMLCSRTMLNEHVWGFNYVKSNVIDVYINRLREKLENGFDKKMIQTIRNSGYKLQQF